MSAAPPGHVVELQAVRGIAAATVMIGHCLGFYDTPAWFHTASLIFNGRAAVVIFFVLSGYVLAQSLRHASLGGGTVAAFYVKRAFRIYPAIWFASLLGLLYLGTLHWQIPVPDAGSGAQRQFRADRMTGLHIAASFAGALAFILPQLWSIFVEIVYSVLAPFVTLVSRRGIAWFAGVFLGVLLLSFTIGNRTYYNIALYMPDFLFGAAISLAGAAPGGARRGVGLRIGILAAATLLLLCTQFFPFAYYDPVVHLIESVLSAAVILCVIHLRGAVRLLRTPFAAMLGDISYSVYLIHYVVLCVVVKAIAVALPGLDVIGKALLLTIATTLITLPVAWAMYRCVELPGIRIGKRAWPGVERAIRLVSRQEGRVAGTR